MYAKIIFLVSSVLTNICFDACSQRNRTCSVHTDGDLRLGIMRFAASVFVYWYNQTQERAAETASISNSPPRVASFRTPSGSIALQFGGPWICMSPERLLGLECSYSSDVWSLGVCSSPRPRSLSLLGERDSQHKRSQECSHRWHSAGAAVEFGKETS